MVTNILQEYEKALETVRSLEAKIKEAGLPFAEPSKPDLSLIMQTEMGRKVLAIRTFDLDVYVEGTKVIILEGLEQTRLASREDGSAIVSRVHCYRIVDFTWGDWLYNNAAKIAGFGMILKSPKGAWDNHIVLVNDDFQEVLVDLDDLPF